MLDTQNIKVLVIDDNKVDVKQYFNELSQYFLMSFAPTAPEAWELINRAPLPDCIILDMNLPNAQSTALSNRFKENQFTKDIPIIFVSSTGDEQANAQAFELGGADFLEKPPVINELVARVKRHVAVYRKTKQLESLIYIDPLTHLPNVTKFHEVLNNEWARCARYWHHMSLLLIEIYDLEAVLTEHGNDAYFTAVGSIAEELSSVGARPGDLLATIDNTVFGLLLSDCSHSGALLKANEIAQLFESKTTNKIMAPNLTCTIGLAVSAPAGGGTPQELYQAAEKLLFEAKEKGRGKIYETNEIIGFEVAS